ncbi:hypothetical protein [Desulfosporosinus sp. BG]|uniref:hypothetical protein n=1 Tax=Desulfosporosinus sp. BG TaxID=1633135 RepID=UPI001A9A38A7|nr:hypothetical protein [Desulfosporosinus sp. BG]
MSNLLALSAPDPLTIGNRPLASLSHFPMSDGIGKLALITAYEDGIRMVIVWGIAYFSPDFTLWIKLPGSMEGLPE